MSSSKYPSPLFFILSLNKNLFLTDCKELGVRKISKFNVRAESEAVVPQVYFGLVLAKSAPVFDGIIGSMDMNLSKLWEMVEDRGT